MKRSLSMLLAAMVAGLLVTGATHVSRAQEEGGVAARGDCSLGTQWSIHMVPEIGVEFEVEIESGVPGQTWNVELIYNKHVLLQTTEETEEDGGFEIIRVENNANGEDVARLRAMNPETGEVCRGELQAEL